ncbi:hypothetical protein P153DRAFT_334908 [Dothidotthia symphoricarpi CBS 119687]|uniref:Alpha/beta-hydrolase n=1 Tax=Dothidotthia symphoricarpi CBS 119687 TaxID=1392245 RepID=A0A6A6AM65_9PLEO|nr:uncharacterized protein P153DRAFT_334908 [Dothidotthia symphoricarpi CBS 119687]KAF2132218.1 hypothetical protein P153DRAFT_334908 [Dothidotthia symphoricarpi CBS 119687]
MHRPPEVHYSFTIPSIHDDTTLDCRVYHPDLLSEYTGETSRWKKRGIVMAHPYAPMGGSCDDRVVGVVVDEFVRAGWVVGTFNFRGAHGSKGRTSWSGRPELNDYMSFAAFFIHYLSYVQPYPIPHLDSMPEQSPLPSSVESLHQQINQPPVVILGGYSYGSLILKNLPPLSSILQPFATPVLGTAADEILLRAHKLSDQTNLSRLQLLRDHERGRKDKTDHGRTLSVIHGGEETPSDKRRSSREVRRSVDGFGRHSHDLGDRLRNISHRKPKDEISPVQLVTRNAAISMPDVRYLLISPLTLPISTLAAPALGQMFWSRGKDKSQDVIGKHTSLAVYGDHDVFSSAKKIREWAVQLRAEPGSCFSSVEVAGAGHFWVEKGVEEKLRNALREWEVGVR